MCSADQVELMSSVELFDDVLAKYVTYSSIVVCPTLDVNLGVGPKQITHEALIWDVLGSILFVDHLKISQIWGESTMHTEDSIVNDSGYWENVEDCSKFLIDLNVISSLALVVESIHTVDGLTFMVSSQKVDRFREFDLVGQEETDGLYTLLATVNVVSREEELTVWPGVSSYVEKSEKIKVLAVHITKDFDRSLEVKEHRVLAHHLGSFVDDKFYCSLVQLYRFAPLSILHLCKLLDDHIGGVFLLCISLWKHKIFVSLEFILNFGELFLSNLIFGKIIGYRLAVIIVLRNLALSTLPIEPSLFFIHLRLTLI